jgi:hypothetical protein
MPKYLLKTRFLASKQKQQLTEKNILVFKFVLKLV